MSITTLTRPDAAALLSDPLFRQGFADFFGGVEPTRDSAWMPEEQEAYERGRDFAAWCADEDEGKIALSRGSLPNPAALQFLTRAINMGEVR